MAASKSLKSSSSLSDEGHSDFDSIRKLGDKLVAQLDLSQSHDLLSRWMAHYVAQLIAAADAAPRGKARTAAQKACAAAILELWSHRADLYRDRAPLGAIEPIMRTLAALDPEAPRPFHFREILGIELPLGDKQARQWFELARDLDFASRLLIDFLIRRAAEDAIDQTVDWIAAARAAGLLDGADIRLTAALADKLGQARLDREAEARRLKSQLERLSGFLGAANGLKTVLMAELAALETPAPEARD
jgi:hypothetical protein